MISREMELYLSRPWTKNYDEGVPPDVDVTYMPLYSVLDRTVAGSPDADALIFFGRRIKYRELGDASDRFAAFLRRLGLGKGDVVALLLPNSPQFVIAYYGALKAGCILTPMNPLYTPREISHQASDADAKAIVALDLFWDKVRASGYEFRHAVVAGLEEYMPAYIRPLYKAKMRGQIPRRIEGHNVARFRDALREPPLRERAPVDPHSDVATLMYTGGTTGTPKGAEITHANIVANLHQIEAILRPVSRRLGVERHVLIGILPWFHIYGQVTVMHFGIFIGAAVVAFPRFDPVEAMRAVEKYRATLFHGVPTLYTALLNHPKFHKFDMRSLIACISGAAPLPGEVARRFEEATGARLREGYGLTETAVVTHVNPILGKYKVGSIGLPIPSTYAAVADPESPTLLKPGEVGEIVVSGPQVMRGYHNRPEENAAAFFECCGLRWFRTGDMGYMDEDGYFYVVDRKKDLIKYKGYSVYPREIEEVLYGHECVREAAVIGVPDPEAGEVPKAYVALKQDCVGRVTEEDIRAYLKERLAAYKVPKKVEFREDLPKSAVGKVLRRKLKEEAQA